MNVPGAGVEPEGEEYGTVDDLCVRLHSLVDRVATLQRPPLLWALVVMAEELLGDSPPRSHHVWGTLCATCCWVLVL